MVTMESEVNVRPDVSIRLAGYGQDGIQSIGQFLARLAGRCGQEVLTFMTIPATVAGGNSVFQVRMGRDVRTVGDEVDILVVFYEASFEEHGHLLKPGGILLYDSGEFTPPSTVDGRLIGVPFGKETETALGGKGRGKNLFVLGLIAQLVELDLEKLREIFTERFARKGEAVLGNVLKAFEAGLHHDLGGLDGSAIRVERSGLDGASGRRRITMDGNQAMAYGLITAGVRYGASYPITPATPIMEILRAELPQYGGVFLQTEDELAAACAAIGMSYGGHLAVTTTSGPGMSLKLEALSFATMAEIPLLVVNVQRGGPSTGIPTQVEQSDLLQAIWGSHGDNPRPVLAAVDVEDCFHIALEAARLAREFSTPVIIMTDQILATRFQGFVEPDLGAHWIEPVLDLTPRDENFLPYALDRLPRHAPPGTFMRSGQYPTVTGLEHDEAGKPNPGPENHMRMSRKRREKIKQLGETLPLLADAIYGEAEGDLLVVGWGSTFGPIREAVDSLRAEGHRVSHSQMRYIHPLPRDSAEVLDRFGKILVVEMNDEGVYGYGQLAYHLRAALAVRHIRSLCKTDGLTFRVREVVDAALSALNTN